MKIRKQKLSIEEARQMDMVKYLSRLGHEPAKIRNVDYWYYSPLREEKTPSFKVNQRLNRWYDHGLGKGGNIIDFAILYHDCTIGEFLKEINGSFSFRRPLISSSPKLKVRSIENKITILRERSLLSFPLYHYLLQRRIPFELAEDYLKEVDYILNGRQYYGIGFKNDAGGYEIRNPYFKGSSSPKDITTFDNDSKEAVVFEGFMDFLSFLSIYKNCPPCRSDFVILNSLSFFERARPFMEQHEVIRLYLDHDRAGQNFSCYATSLSNKYRDESSLYEHYKDLNDWTMNIGKGQQKSNRQHL